MDAVDAIIAKVEQDTLGIVQAADQLEDAFRAMDLMYVSHIPSRQVGFDPVNRDGEGGNAQEVHLLASDIAFVGWSWKETTHAVCVEVEPGTKDVEVFNRLLCAGVDLAPVEENSIHFGSLSCGHTSMGLRAIAAAMPSTCALLSENGRLSLTKLLIKDPEYAKAVTRGLRWNVIRWPVRARYPKALPIIQAVSSKLPPRQRSSTQDYHYYCYDYVLCPPTPTTVL